MQPCPSHQPSLPVLQSSRAGVREVVPKGCRSHMGSQDTSHPHTRSGELAGYTQQTGYKPCWPFTACEQLLRTPTCHKPASTILGNCIRTGGLAGTASQTAPSEDISFPHCTCLENMGKPELAAGHYRQAGCDLSQNHQTTVGPHPQSF